MPVLRWQSLSNLRPPSYTCGHCGKLVGPNVGYYPHEANVSSSYARIYICTFCTEPTYFYGDKQTPGARYGDNVDHLPIEVAALYNEARDALSVSAYTASVLACRKILMNVAVAQGAEQSKSFMHYVEYLSDKGYVPPDGKGWVDHIRKKGNEATHEIQMMSQADAQELVAFTEMLLKFVYEFPARVPQAPASS